ncbi:MAG: crossover junction endodeoxyribonuclease RuvC [Planctomycetota bacterium]
MGIATDAGRAEERPIVLGIDPGTRVVGYGAIVAHGSKPRLLAAGVLRAERGASVPERLGWIQREIGKILEVVRPTVVVVEQAFASRNMQSALRVGEGRGVVLACASSFGAVVVQYPPAVAKRAVVGNGAADKVQVCAMVRQMLGDPDMPESLDTTDALALALTYFIRGAEPARAGAKSTILEGARTAASARLQRALDDHRRTKAARPGTGAPGRRV